MITFTKEQLIASAHARIEFAEMMLAGELEPLKERTWSIELELARIALASLEAEAVCVIDQSNLDYLKSGADADVWPASRTEMGDVLLYRTAPPAPANAEPVAWLWSHRKHPSEVTLVRPEDDEMAEGSGWSGWSCQALYAAQPAPVSVPDIATVETTYPDVQTNWQDAKMYAEGWNACRSAMLQGAEPVTTAYKLRDAVETIHNSGIAIDAEKILAERDALNYPAIPDGWVACSDRMPEDDDFVYIWPRPDFGVELHVGQYCECHPKGDGWYAQVYEQNYGIEWYPINVTHWIPLPAAPQQEVKP
ncbi:DUF551 domain-containing protein [Enterobacter roggenkampii]|uniref:DUF551 domain-containing protein n=1 Tax=Enterobacter roggenkampii TaxID=1812935 RepID=UPI00292AB28B|nr:DUF551 domain-containing protein [Enterobacter roggenkampii]MDV0452676.1 DUF551 domain-containing protein [Enterobacter roggenkampii]